MPIFTPGFYQSLTFFSVVFLSIDPILTWCHRTLSFGCAIFRIPCALLCGLHLKRRTCVWMLTISLHATWLLKWQTMGRQELPHFTSVQQGSIGQSIVFRDFWDATTYQALIYYASQASPAIPDHLLIPDLFMWTVCKWWQERKQVLLHWTQLQNYHCFVLFNSFLRIILTHPTNPLKKFFLEIKFTHSPIKQTLYFLIEIYLLLTSWSSALVDLFVLDLFDL